MHNIGDKEISSKVVRIIQMKGEYLHQSTGSVGVKRKGQGLPW